MIDTTGDIWDYLGDAVVAVTTSGSVTRDGRAVLGRGCARQARIRFPDLPARLGELIRSGGNHVHLVAEGLVSFPVEESAWSLPDLRLIRRSAAELRAMADALEWGRIVVPRPGCGGGGLRWSDVAPLLAPHFDGRFLVVHIPGGE